MMLKSILLWLAVSLPLLIVNALQCPPPGLCSVFLAEGFETLSLAGEGAESEDSASICAMCSDSAAAVRWRVREGEDFTVLLLRYTCTDLNGTEIYAGVYNYT